MCQVVQLYSVVDIVVMSGEVACCSVVCVTVCAYGGVVGYLLFYLSV